MRLLRRASPVVGVLAVCAGLARAVPVDGILDPDYFGIASNQMLGPVPPGTCDLGPANGVDFADVPGAQHFVVEQATPTTRTSRGGSSPRTTEAAASPVIAVVGRSRLGFVAPSARLR